MVEPTAEQFAQRAFDLSLITERQLHGIWAHFGTHDVPIDEFANHLVRRGLLTNYQVEKLLKGETAGFFYGDYKVLYFVGNGSFARVYRAVHKDTGQVVALKVLRKRYSEDPTELERFLREGKVGCTLRHANIVPIYEVQSVKRSHCLVMAFVEGQSLRDFVRIRRKVDPLEATEIMAGIAAGLAYGSEKGVTHRDLKLSNVLISSEGLPQIVDFGLAAVSAEGKGEAYTNTRTIDYAALEKLTGVAKDDARSDIFFAGCIYYHMLTGRAPMSDTRDRAQRMSFSRFREIKPIRDVLPDLPLVVEKIVNKSMSLDPEKRYAKPVELLVDLRKAVKALQSTDATQEEAEPQEGEGKTVMVVESNSAVQDALRAALKQHGYRVLVISDAARAWQRISDDPTATTALIISTAALGREALELYQRLTLQESTKDIPLVLLLGKNQRKLLAKLSLAEHQRAVSMPLKLASLRQALQEITADAQVDPAGS